MTDLLRERRDEFLDRAYAAGLPRSLRDSVLARSKLIGTTLVVPNPFSASLIAPELETVRGVLNGMGLVAETVAADETPPPEPVERVRFGTPEPPEKDLPPMNVLVDGQDVYASRDGERSLVEGKGGFDVLSSSLGCRKFETLMALAEALDRGKDVLLRTPAIAVRDFGRHSLESKRSLADGLADFLARYKGTLVLKWEGAFEPGAIEAWAERNSFQAFSGRCDEDLRGALLQGIVGRLETLEQAEGVRPKAEGKETGGLS